MKTGGKHLRELEKVEENTFGYWFWKYMDKRVPSKEKDENASFEALDSRRVPSKGHPASWAWTR